MNFPGSASTSSTASSSIAEQTELGAGNTTRNCMPVHFMACPPDQDAPIEAAADLTSEVQSLPEAADDLEAASSIEHA